ncbi:hypothetical protein F4777DRAFT_560275 [Nemania sp. FL0916]|nr:hypothetical protein F4777DRAFT_560275 [Nemania sp. FL0916]
MSCCVLLVTFVATAGGRETRENSWRGSRCLGKFGTDRKLGPATGPFRRCRDLFPRFFATATTTSQCLSAIKLYPGFVRMMSLSFSGWFSRSY